MHKDYERFLATKTGHMKPTSLRTLRAMLSRLPEPEGLTEKWLQGRMKEVGAQTVRNERKLALRMLRFLGLPTEEIEQVKVAKARRVTVADLYSAEELLAIFKATHNTRDRALLQVLYESAARAGELLSMTIENITFDEDGIATAIITGKTGTRRIGLKESVPALKLWINTHPIGSGHIWVGIKMPFNQLSYVGLYQVVKRAATRAGLKKREACHMFRHTRITEVRNRGVTGEALRMFAGWTEGSNMEQTYHHLSDAAMNDEFRVKIFGLEANGKHTDPLIEGRPCPHCQERNDVVARVCVKCGRQMIESTSDMDALKDQVAHLERLIVEVANGKFSGHEFAPADVKSSELKPKAKKRPAKKKAKKREVA